MPAKSSIHIKPIKLSSEDHNRRTKDVSYSRQDLVHLNESWEIDSIQNRRARIEESYQKTTGQQMQKKATPIREGVFLIGENTTIERCKSMAKRIESNLGPKAVQIHLHRDEGHFDSGGKWKPNLHGHIVFDWTKEDGKSHKLNQKDMRKMQDIVSEELGLERGIKSNKIHLDSKSFKAMKQQEESKLLAKEQKTEQALVEMLYNREKGEKKLEKLYPFYAFKKNIVQNKQREQEQDRGMEL